MSEITDRMENISVAITDITIKQSIGVEPSVIESAAWKAYSIRDLHKRVAFIPDDDCVVICLEHHDRSYSTQIESKEWCHTVCDILNATLLGVLSEDVNTICQSFYKAQRPIKPPDKEENYTALLVNQLSTKTKLSKEVIFESVKTLDLDSVVSVIYELLYEQNLIPLADREDPVLNSRKVLAYNDLTKATMNVCDIGEAQASEEVLNALLSDTIQDHIVKEIKRSKGWR